MRHRRTGRGMKVKARLGWQDKKAWSGPLVGV